MKFSEKWLREWVNPAISSDELVAQITLAGLEVDDVEAAAGDFSGVVVGEVINAEQHPNADKLRICSVSDGTAEYQVVCGAPNARMGIKVAFAMVGAILPGGFKIKKAKLRQAESFGMLCSGQELEINEDHDGIMELPADAPVGTDLRTYMMLDDQIIDVDLTPNRGDCLSIAGLAREVGVLNSTDLLPPSLSEVAPQIEDTFPVKVSAPAGCPRITARVVRDVDVTKPSPQWMQERLRRSGIRSIDAVVDITAYVMLELGQPMHAYDLDKLNSFINVRMASQGEELTLLNGQTVELNEDILVIADSEGAIGMAGIMGGDSTGVSEQTRNVLLEAAFFDPITIAGKARSFGLHTDASHRFERGVDYVLQRQAMDRATELLQNICGGEAGPVIEQVADQHLPKADEVVLRKQRLNSLLAFEFDDAQVEDILTRLGLKLLKSDAQSWTFSSPSWRFDMAIEADLIEEVARVYGYNNLPSTNPVGSMDIPAKPEVQRPMSLLRRHMVSRGYQEAITYSFVEPGLQRLLDDQNTPVELANPISADMSVMRTSIWPGLIKALQYNQNRQQNRVRLFETGQRFIPSVDGLQQEDVLAGLISGSRSPESWHGKDESVDFFDMKGDLESLFSLTGNRAAFSFSSAEHVALHPGQSAAIYKQGQLVGYVGALHPGLVKELGLQGPVFLFEISMAAITEGLVPAFSVLSKHPEVRRDMAVLVAESVPVSKLEAIIAEHAGDYLQQVGLFDVYAGAGIEPDQKSLALGLTWQHPERTLNDEEVNQWFEQVVNAMQTQLGATLRS
jgi:phenylalanyl-tRNA synthetase beta chain